MCDILAGTFSQSQEWTFEGAGCLTNAMSQTISVIFVFAGLTWALWNSRNK
jgi:prolipoprotein diacylglyceryltransferase